MPRLIACDLDGTLFGPDSQVSDVTREAVKRVTERGHTVVAITGRSWRTAWDRLKPVTGIDRVLGSNGATEFLRSENRVVWSCPITGDTWLAWLDRIRKQLPSASFGWETEAGIGFDDAFAAEAGGRDQLERGGQTELQQGMPVYKLYVRSPDRTKEALQAEVRALLGSAAEVSTSGAPFVEVTAAGVDKAAALRRVAQVLGFSLADTIAFGDNHNDLPMLELAGLSVAMGNGVPEVRGVADRVAPDNAENGVAWVLDYLVSESNL